MKRYIGLSIIILAAGVSISFWDNSKTVNVNSEILSSRLLREPTSKNNNSATQENPKPFKNDQGIDFTRQQEDVSKGLEKLALIINDNNKNNQNKFTKQQKKIIKKFQDASNSSELNVSLDENRFIGGIYFSEDTVLKNFGETQEQVNVNVTRFIQENNDLIGIDERISIKISTKCMDLCRTVVDKSLDARDMFDHRVIITTFKGALISVEGAIESLSLPKFIPESMTIDDIITSINLNGTIKSIIDKTNVDSEGVSGISRIGGRDFYSQKVKVHLSDFEEYDVYFVQNTKQIVHIDSSVNHLMATGTNLNGESYNFDVRQQGSSYFLVNIDERRNQLTGVKSVDANANGDYPNLGEKFVSSPYLDKNWNPSAVSAIQNFDKTIDFYRNTISYTPFSNNPIELYVGGNYNNASATANRLFIFAEGDGKTFSNTANSLDVMAHEITHGVIYEKSQLQYRFQSGALNESFSDFFGVIIAEKNNWTLGEGLILTPPYILRSMSNPKSGLDPQPAHFAEYFSLPYSKDTDYGGVHINSGIPNRALYLLAEGLTNEGIGESIGRTKATKLVFNTLEQLPRNATFEMAYYRMLALAKYFYGQNSTEAFSVQQAWNTVGVPVESYVENIGQQTTNYSGRNVVAYLNPINDPRIYSKTDNKYNIYLQFFDEDYPEYIPDLNKGPINETLSAYAQPSVVPMSDGSYTLIYKDYFGNIKAKNTADNTETLVASSSVGIANFSISSDFKKVVATAKGSNKIALINIEDSSASAIEVRLNSTSEITKGQPVSSIDAIRFDPTNRFLIFDYYACNSASSDCYVTNEAGYWSIGILDLETKQISHLFPFQSQDINSGFPTFANSSSDLIAFDVVGDINKDGIIESLLTTYSLKDNTFNVVGYPDNTSSKNGEFGVPSFSSDDSKIVYSVHSDDGPSLFSVALEGNQDSKSTDQPYSILAPFLTYLPRSEPAIYTDKAPLLIIENSSLDFGFSPVGAKLTTELCLANDSNFDINLYNLLQDKEYISWALDGSTIASGTKICTPISLDTSKLNSAQSALNFNIIHNGSNSPSVITAKYTEDIDTDGDGITNSQDNDDDNDGVLDINDEFPLDSTRSSVTNAPIAQTIGDAKGMVSYDASTQWDLSAYEASFYFNLPQNTNELDQINLYFDSTLSPNTSTILSNTNSLATITYPSFNQIRIKADWSKFSPNQEIFISGVIFIGETVRDDLGTSVKIEFTSTLKVLSEVGPLKIITFNNIDDSDTDKIIASQDNCPNVFNPDQVDLDKDGIGNACDDDTDGDSVPNVADAFALDPSESLDTDLDGIGNNNDDDDDGDGVLDINDDFPLDPNKSKDIIDTDFDGIEDSKDNCKLVANKSQTDTDNDSLGDMCDEDDDGDGVPDIQDAYPLDATKSTDELDTDDDGTPDDLDTDDDNDGYLDSEEVDMGTNPLSADDFPKSSLPLPILIKILQTAK